MASFNDLKSKLDDKYRLYKETDETKISASRDSFQSQRNEMQNKYTPSYSIDADGVNDWFKNSSEFSSTFKVGDVSKYKIYSDEDKNDIKSLLSQATEVRRYLRDHKDEIKDYDKLYESYGKTVGYLRSVESHINDINDYYGNFETEGDYLGYLITQTTHKSDIDSVNARIDAYSQLQSRVNEIDSLMITASGENKDALEAEKEHIQTYIRQYERGNKDKDQVYAKNLGKEDYKEKASNREFGNSTRDDYDEFDTKAYGGRQVSWDNGEAIYIPAQFDYSMPYEDAMKAMGVELAINDELGFYFDNLGTYAEEGESHYYSPTERIAGVEANEVLMKGDRAHWSNLTNDEIQMYYYLLNAQGKDAAMSFLNGLESELAYRETEDYQDYIKEASAGELVFNNALSVPLNIVGGALAFVDDAIHMVTGEDVEPYNSAHSMKNSADSIRGVTAQKLNDLTNNAEFLGMTTGDVYQSLMSGVDSFAGGNLFGKAYLGLMAVGAASSGVKDLYESGASTSQIITGAFINGAAEYIGEMIPFDNFLKLKGSTTSLRKLISGILLQGGYEMGGEIVTEITNIFGEAINLRSESDWAKLLRENDGAFLETVKDIATDRVWKAGAGGFISGIAMGGGQTTLGYASNRSAVKANGRYIMENGGVDNLKALAYDVAGAQKGITGIPTKVSLNRQANRISNTMKNNGRNAVRVGQLAEQVYTVRDAANIEDIASVLVEKGLSKGKAKRVAEYLYNGTNIGDIESKSIRKLMESDAVKSVRKAISKEDSSVSKRNRQYALAIAGLKENEDGTISLSDHNQEIVHEIEKMMEEDSHSQTVQEDVGVVETADIAYVNEVEGEFDYNADGKTILNNADGSAKDVSIKKISSIKNGAMMVELDDGEVVNAKDISYASSSEALVYESIVNLGVSAETGNAIISVIKGANISNSAGINSAMLAYSYGLTNQQERLSDLSIPNGVKNALFNIGRSDAKVISNEIANKARSRTVSKNKPSGKVNYVNKINKSKLNPLQRSIIAVAEFLAKASPLDIYVFESKRVAGKTYINIDGKELESSANGWYVVGSNKIYLDINSGNNYEGLGLFTLAHESGHYIRDWNANAWQTMADIIVQEIDRQAKADKSKPTFESLHTYKFMKYSNNRAREEALIKEGELNSKDADYAGKTDSELRDMAYEDVICDSLASLMADKETFVEFANRLDKKDHKLWVKFQEIIKSFLDKLDEWLKSYNGVKTEDEAGQAIQNAAKEARDIIRDLYVSAFIGANENYNKAVEKSALGEEPSNKATQKNTTSEGDVKMAEREKFAEYNKPITLDDIKVLRSIGRKSINAFTAEEVEMAQKWAYKFYQQLGTKSPFFRRWFGDWRAYDDGTAKFKSNIQRLSLQTPQQAKEYFNNGVKSKTLFRGDVKNDDTGFVINVGAQVYNDTLTYSNRELSRHNNVDDYQIRLSILSNIQNIVQFSVLFDTEVALKGDKKSQNMYQSFFHKFYTIAEFDGKQYLVKLTVDELNSDSTTRRAYNVNDIKISPVAVSQVYKPADTTDDGGDLFSTISISDLFKLVKNYDAEFTPKPVNKALIENGKPKVFYHGAKKNGGFTEFKSWQYFTDNKTYAERYAERGNANSLYEVFLTANKIFDTRDAEAKSIFEKIRQEYGLGELQDTGLPDWTDGYDLSDYLDEHPELGYDAIILDEGGDLVDGKPVSRGESIVIKDSTQIKSAEDGGNIGTFSEAERDIRYSERDYSYDTLVSKPDMKLTVLSGNVPNNRADVVYYAKENAAKIGTRHKDGSVSVKVKDIDTDVIIGTKGLIHGLSRGKQLHSKSPIIVNIGEILSNSIKVNEANPKKDNAERAYVLIGYAQDKNGNSYITRSIVNRINHELESVDVLYAVNIKKESAVPKAPRVSTPSTDSTISISDLLDIVNRFYPEVLSEDVLKHYGHTERPAGNPKDLGESMLFSDRNLDMDNRTLLSNALESAAQNDEEIEILNLYKENIDALEKDEARLKELNKEIHDTMFTKGKRDQEKIDALMREKRKIVKRIGNLDKLLLKLEASTPLRNLLKREGDAMRKEYKKKGKALVKEQYQGRELRNKIKVMASKFHKMANNPSSGTTGHVPIGAVKAVAQFCDLFAESQERYLERSIRELETRSGKLGTKILKDGMTESHENEAGIIERKKVRLAKTAEKINMMRKQYESLKGDSALGIYYDEHTAESINKLSILLAGKDIYEMNSTELNEVYNTMKEMMHTIMNANKLFAMGKDKTLIDVVKRWGSQIRQTNEGRNKASILIRRYFMKQMSPDTFFNYISGFIKGNEGIAVQKMFSDGTARMIRVQRDFYNLFQPLTESKDARVIKEVRDLMSHPMKNMVDWGLKDADGNAVKTTRGMMLQAYMLLSQADSLDSIARGGFKIPKAKEYYSGNIDGAYGDISEGQMYSMTNEMDLREIAEQIRGLEANLDAFEKGSQEAEQIKSQIKSLESKMNECVEGEKARLVEIRETIEKKMTDTEIEFVEKAHEWYKQSGLLMQEVFEQMYGYTPNLVTNYVAIHRDLSTVKTDIRSTDDAFNLENSGFTKERVKSIAPILLTDFFKELSNQQQQISRYYGFAQVQRDFNRIWNMRVPGTTKTIKAEVEARYGKGQRAFTISGLDYVDNYIKSVSGANHSSEAFPRLYSNAASATLSLNPRVAFSQLASIPTASAVVGWKAMAIGFAKGLHIGFSKNKKIDLSQKNVWFYQRYRGNGGITEIADLKAKNGLWAKAASSNVGKYLFNWCQNFDVFATAIEWSMAENYVESQGIKKGTEGYDEAVEQAYTDIIRKTQPNYTETERSDLLRDKRGGMKLFTMFKTQSNQNLNILIEANGELMRAKRDFKAGVNGVTKADVKKATSKFVNAATSVTIGGTLTFVLLRTMVNFVLGLVNPYRDDDDEVTLDKTIEGMVKEIFSSLSGMFLIGGQFYDVMFSIFSGDNYYGLKDTAISLIADVLETIVETGQTIFDEDKDLSFEQIDKLLRNTLSAFGVPYDNASKIISGIKMWYNDIVNGTFGQYTSDKTSDAQYRNQFIKAYRNGDADKCNDIIAYFVAKSDEPTDNSIEAEISSGFKTHLKGLYIKGEVTENEVVGIMTEYFDMDTDEVKSFVKEWNCKVETGIAYGDIKDYFMSGKITQSEAENMYVKYGGYTEQEAYEKVTVMEFVKQNPQCEGISFKAVDNYNTYCKGKNISAEVFYDAYKYNSSAESDKDKNGKTISGSKKKKVLNYINKLNLTRSQKDALYYALGMTASTITEVPWQ